MNKINPIEKGQCDCCANKEIQVKKCKLKQCDYSMCSHCYNKYYQTNTLCPACRTEVETNLCKILINYINDDEEETNIENNRPPQTTIYRICTCFNYRYYLNNNCCCLYDLTCRNTNNYRYYLNKFKEHFINLLAIFAIIILASLIIIGILAFGRLIYLFTLEVFFPGLSQSYLINDILILILTSIFGLLFAVIWSYCLFCGVTILFLCCGCDSNDDYY